MLVQPSDSLYEKKHWDIIFLSDIDGQYNTFKQQAENIEFNNIGCQIFHAKTSQAVSGFLSKNAALLVISHSDIESAVTDVYYLAIKKNHPDLCVLALVESGEMQQNLLTTMLVDQVATNLNAANIKSAILMGLKCHYDTHLLKISENLLHSMKSINDTSTGDAYLKELVTNIKNFLGTHFVIIGETDALDDTVINTRMVFINGEYSKNFTYKRAGTPCEGVLKSRRVLTYPDNVAEIFPEDKMLAKMKIESYMGTVIYSASGNMVGILVTMDCSGMDNYQLYEPMLDFFASRAGIEIERQQAEDKLIKVNEELELKVEARTQELKSAHKELLQAAHQAGMADIAAGVLHNVGNVFNSMSVACQAMQDDFSNSKLSRLTDVSYLLSEHKNELGKYMTSDGKGRQIPEYINKLSEVLNEEAAKNMRNLNTMQENGYLIQEVIRNQLDYAQLTSFEEDGDVAQLVDKVLLLQMSAMDEAGITIEKKYEKITTVKLQKNKLVHVSLNYAKEMGGTMRAFSPGVNLGATFVIEIFKDEVAA